MYIKFSYYNQHDLRICPYKEDKHPCFFVFKCSFLYLLKKQSEIPVLGLVTGLLL
jgi:hypothetical protein